MNKVYIKKLKDIIVNNELNDVVSYTDETMKETSLKAWSFLYEILLDSYNIKLSKDQLFYNEYKKPYLKDNPLYFNISHSNQLIAIIVSDKECGIDIEYIDETRNLAKISRKVLSPNELLLYNLSIRKHKYFYKQWTKKEAYYKQIGTGIKYNKISENIDQRKIRSYIYIDKETKDKYYISYTK